MLSEEDTTSPYPPAKRRKVRKGTQSCWACKRRKVRCIFSESTNTVCDNCLKRKTQCISQQYPDDASSIEREYAVGVEDRLSRVEDMLQSLVRANTSKESCVPAGIIESGSAVRMGDVSGIDSLVTPSRQDADLTLTAPADAIPTPNSSCSDAQTSSYTGLAHDLIAAWPSPLDFAAICTLPIHLSTHTHMHLCTPPSAPSIRSTTSSTREMLTLPPPGSHPVLLARKLLFLGSLLQGALSSSHPPSSSCHLSSTKLKEIMSTAISTAISLVTTNDSLTASVEGVECIMIEAMIHNYTGNLHRAWLAVRRAIAVAQMIGLDRESTHYKILDAGAKAEFDAECFCYRIVEMERYLSLTLGLSAAGFTCRALEPEAMAGCVGMERLARMHCVVAERLLRDQGVVGRKSGSGELREMEDMLQRAAGEMAPRWWLVPEMEGDGIEGVEDPFREVGRMNYQFSHYHLIMRLHLPYMLRSEHGDDSKIAAAGASREVLARYITFRRWNPGHFYCRGTDFLAFMAVVVLCLAHISSHSTRKPSSINRLLTSSRLSDRGMMERTVEILEAMRDDATATKLVRMMRHVLDVELDALKGVGYNAVASERSHDQADYEGTFVNGRSTLQLHIPYVGTIDLHRKLYPDEALDETGVQTAEIGDTTTAHGTPSGEKLAFANDSWSQQAAQPDIDWILHGEDPDFAAMLDSAQYLGAPGDLTLQSINESLFSSLFNGLDGSVETYNL